MNVVTLTQCYYPNKAALDAAIAREGRIGTYKWCLSWDLAKSASAESEGLITQFRDMLRQTGRAPYQGFAVLFYATGLTWQHTARMGVDYDTLSTEAQISAMEQVQAQRRKFDVYANDRASTMRAVA